MDEGGTQEGRTMAKAWEGRVIDSTRQWDGQACLHVVLDGGIPLRESPNGRVRIVEMPPPAEYFCWSGVAGDKQWDNPANWRAATADDKPGADCCVIHRNFLPRANTKDASAEEVRSS